MQVSKAIKPIGVRFIPDVKDFFKSEAACRGRSFNSEIMQVLKDEMDARISKRKQSKAA
jgi:hypothetical protein